MVVRIPYGSFCFPLCMFLPQYMLTDLGDFLFVQLASDWCFLAKFLTFVRAPPRPSRSTRAFFYYTSRATDWEKRGATLCRNPHALINILQTVLCLRFVLFIMHKHAVVGRGTGTTRVIRHFVFILDKIEIIYTVEPPVRDHPKCQV